MIRNGARLQSQVDDTQVIVVKATDALTDLRSGGALMIPLGGSVADGQVIDPALAAGTLMGKRYVDDTGAEVLVTKAGRGTLSIGTTPLSIKEAAPLPASD
jgi:hypothetical protein